MSAQNPNIEKVLESWDDVPPFQSHNAEREYWQKTGLSVSLIQSAMFTPEGSDSTTITLRMDPRMLTRIKRLARQRYLNYQSMIKQWLAERMEKELRNET
jgi:predicted DNA binding CopG/RHH family protein